MIDFARQLQLDLYKKVKAQDSAVLEMERRAINWAVIITFTGLHDHYGFGRGRFRKIMDIYDRMPDIHETDIHKWEFELKPLGYDAAKVTRMCEAMARKLCKRKKGTNMKEQSKKCMAATLTLMFHTLQKEFGFSKIRITGLFEAVSINAYVLAKGEVSIWEFMKMLQLQCDITYEDLEEHERDFGEVEILLKPVYVSGGVRNDSERVPEPHQASVLRGEAG